LLRTNLPTASVLGDTRSWFLSLCDDSGLLVSGAAPPTDLTGQDLNTPKPTVHVVISVKQNDSSKPVA
jgi:hypothetical protein